MQKKRILMIGYSTDKGGVESYIRNVCSELAENYDIIYHWPVMTIDGKEWILPRNRHNIFKYCRFWKRFFNENHFDIVYFNTCDIVSIDILRFATQAGVSVRIIHSHNTGNQFQRSGVLGMLHKLMEKNSRNNLDKYATDLLACSKSAGDWMFGKRNYTVIKNGIDIDRYSYSIEKKAKVSEILDQCHKPVIACLGRIEGQKNPFLSFEIFLQVCKLNPQAQCIFIGDGEDRAAIEKKVRSLNLSDRILFTGAVDNVNEWLSYIDCLVMPSFFEGLPFALVEAQAAGIYSLVSDTVSSESNITGLVEYKSLQDSPQSWAERLLNLADKQRINTSDRLIEAGFSIRHSAEAVKTIIEERLTNGNC